MTSIPKTLLILGATGQQGGAAARALLAGGWPVRALTRTPDSKAARALAAEGAELVAGDMGDRAALEAAMRGVYGVFSVQPSSWTPDDASNAEELRLGLEVAEAAKAAGVRHFVYASVGGADQQAAFRDMPKRTIEQAIARLGLAATILRPVGFMENYIHPRSGIQHGSFAEPTDTDVTVKLISVRDIGEFVKLAFENPADFIGQTLELAGDSLTPPQIAAALSLAIGRPLPHVHVPPQALKQTNETIALIYEWLNRGEYQVDIAVLHKLHPELMNFDAWLQRYGKQGLDALLRTT